jgi:hypothetical protein
MTNKKTFSDKGLEFIANYGHFIFLVLFVLECRDFSFSNFWSGTTFCMFMWGSIYGVFQYEHNKEKKRCKNNNCSK